MICDEHKRMEKIGENVKKNNWRFQSTYVHKVHSQISQLDLRPVIVIQDFETLFHAFDEQAILSDWQKNGYLVDFNK